MSDLSNKVKRLRAHGMPLRAIAAELGVSTGYVCYQVYGRRRRPTETDSSVIRHVTSLGEHGSWSCARVPISVPRVTFIDGAAA